MGENLTEEKNDTTFAEAENTENMCCCKVCGSNQVEEEYELELCKECRKELSKRPIPLKIKLIFAVIGIIVVIALVNFPKTMQVGIEYKKGEKAERALKYVTAMKHYEKVSALYPNSEKVLSKLYRVYYENGLISEANDTFDKLKVKTKDNQIIKDANKVTGKINLYYYPSKELYQKIDGMKNAKSEDVIRLLKETYDKNPKEIYAAYYLANLYFEEGKYKETLDTINKFIDKYPDFYNAYMLETAAYRELNQYDKAIECCNKVFAHNAEDIDANLALSKIELKRKNNAEGLKYAELAYKLDSGDFYTFSGLALAYHYNNKIKERDDMLTKFQEECPDDEYTIGFLKSIFDGTLQWQQ